MITSGSGSTVNARAGNIMAVWQNTEYHGLLTSSVVFTESKTSDIGSTSGVFFAVEISQSMATLLSKTNSDNWKIKTIVKAI